MFELKPLSRDAIPRALEKAERYRVLNEPREAESICLDILDADPENQPALVVLVLALTDQAGIEGAAQRAREILPRLRSDYERAYYGGIICERRGKACLDHVNPGSASTAYEWFREAMDWYEKAQAIRPAGNDDAILRWNTCARILMRDSSIRPREEPERELPLE